MALRRWAELRDRFGGNWASRPICGDGEGDELTGGTGPPDRTTLGAFALLILMAGGNGVAVRSIYEELDLPFWSAATRFLFAAILFAAISYVVHAAVPRGRALAGALLYGVLFFGGGFALIYWGLVEAPAGLTQVVLACIPLLTLVLALAHGQERFRWDGLAGASLALDGIAVIFRGGMDEGVPPTSLLAIVAGAVCWAEAAIIVKGFPPVHPAMMNAIGMAMGTVILLVLSVIFGESRAVPQTAQTWTS